MTRKCEICGKEFYIEPKRPNTRKCCSTACRKIFNDANRRQPTDGRLMCTKCGETKLITEFYKNNRFIGYRYYCKQCDDALILAHQNRRKQMYVDLKGGKCEKCGYNKCKGALDFHHRDKTTKEFAINKNLSLERMKDELDKCTLLCANCHREEHTKPESW